MTGQHILIVHPEPDDGMDIDHPQSCPTASIYDGRVLIHTCVVGRVADEWGLDMFFHRDTPHPHSRDSEHVKPGRYPIEVWGDGNLRLAQTETVPLQGMSGHEIIGSACTTCGGIKGSTLPTECPGRPLSLTEEDEIAAGRLDYRSGQWGSPWGPDKYLGVTIPEDLRPNWNDQRIEVSWWRRGVEAATEQHRVFNGQQETSEICRCTDSVRSRLGTCPPPGHREHNFCPRVRGDR